MGVLPKHEIKKRLELEITDPKSLVITPLLEWEDTFSPSSDDDSIDLRLGTYFLLPQVPPVPFTYPCRDSAKHSHVRVHVPLGRYLVVPADETFLGLTFSFTT